MYTGLRVGLLLVAWLLIQAITPLRGLMAVALAVVISGIISFVLLDRTRDRASRGLARIFGRIDDRIERSRTAEDIDDDVTMTVPASVDPEDSDVDLGQSDADPEQDGVSEKQQTGGLEDLDESRPDRTL